jgi:hypothetical protein
VVSHSSGSGIGEKRDLKHERKKGEGRKRREERDT